MPAPGAGVTPRTRRGRIVIVKRCDGPEPSWPALCRPSTSLMQLRRKDGYARAKRGHDAENSHDESGWRVPIDGARAWRYGRKPAFVMQAL